MLQNPLGPRCSFRRQVQILKVDQIVLFPTGPQYVVEVLEGQISHILLLNQNSIIWIQLGYMIFATSMTGLQVEKSRIGIALRQVCDASALPDKSSLQRGKAQGA